MALSLVLIRGPMAVGKSTLARALGQRLNWPVVDKDDVADILVDYLSDYSPASYEVMFRHIESLLEQTFSVIMVSSFKGSLGLDTAGVLAEKTQANLNVLSCTCSDLLEWQRRLETRSHRPAHRVKTWQDFERYWRKAAPEFEYDTDYPHLKLDTSEFLEDNVSRACTWLGV